MLSEYVIGSFVCDTCTIIFDIDKLKVIFNIEMDIWSFLFIIITILLNYYRKGNILFYKKSLGRSIHVYNSSVNMKYNDSNIFHSKAPFFNFLFPFSCRVPTWIILELSSLEIIWGESKF